jgi:2-methylcitrate dehydratase PrpD
MDAAITLAKNIVNVKYDDIPDKVLEITKKQILDILSCIIGGSTMPACKEMLELIRDWGGKEESTIFVHGYKVPVHICALINSTMGDALDYDDTHDTSGVHSGTTVIPACFAISERKGRVSGKEFLTSVSVGIDLVHRMGLSTKCNTYKTFGPWNGWEITPLYGFFGAAASAGKILGLDEEKMINAFGIAYAQASGNAQCVLDGALTKRVQPGFATSGGLLSALMAEKGITGAKNSFEGLGGLYNVYHRGAYDPNPLTAELGKKFEGINVCFKPYPCCRATHTSIDATLKLMQKYLVKPAEIAKVTVFTGSSNEVCIEPLESKRNPRTIVDAMFSIPWAVSVALVRGKVLINDFRTEALKDRSILQMTQKVTPKIDTNLSIGLVDPSIVEVKTRDGRFFSERVDFSYGSPQNPISWEFITTKLEDCAYYSAKPISKNNLEKVVEMVKNMEMVDNVCSIIRLLS